MDNILYICIYCPYILQYIIYIVIIYYIYIYGNFYVIIIDGWRLKQTDFFYVIIVMFRDLSE